MTITIAHFVQQEVLTENYISAKSLKESKKKGNILYDKAECAIKEDGSYLEQDHNGRWGLCDYSSHDNPIVNYTYKNREDLIDWYFKDIGWNIDDFRTSQLHSKVSSWLANKLLDRGEWIEILDGEYVWHRKPTGKPLTDLSVICDIFPEFLDRLASEGVTIHTFPSSLGALSSTEVSEIQASNTRIAIVDFDSIEELPKCMHYLVTRKLKEIYNYIVGKSDKYQDSDWYQNAPRIKFRCLEIIDRDKRVIYYGADVDPEDAIECIEEEWIDRVDSISLTYHLYTDGEITEQTMKLDSYVQSDNGRLPNLVFLTTKADENLRDALTLLMDVLFNADDYKYVNVDNPASYFIEEAKSYLATIFDEKMIESLLV